MGFTILTPAHLKGFEKYKICPRWVAPNLLTFIGFILNVVNFLLVAWYDYSFSQQNEIPSWVWSVAGINVFVAYTLDGIDGKQARRTKTSGPLGELFDHGLDSWSTVFIPVLMYSVLGRPNGTSGLSPLRFYFLVWNVFVTFYLTHWEKYNTGVLFLPWAYDFIMVGVTMSLIVTSLTGVWIWRTPLFGINPSDSVEFILYSMSWLTSPTVVFWNIYRSYRDRTGRMRPFLEAIRPLCPLITLLAITSFWAVYSKNDVTSIDPRIMCVMTGTVYSNIALGAVPTKEYGYNIVLYNRAAPTNCVMMLTKCRLIVSQMSNTKCDLSNLLFLPLAAVALVSTSLPINSQMEGALLYAMFVLSLMVHIHYGFTVVKEMCLHFKIECFTVPRSSHDYKY